MQKTFSWYTLLTLLCRVPRPNWIQRTYYTPIFSFLQVKTARNSFFIFTFSLWHTVVFMFCLVFPPLRAVFYAFPRCIFIFLLWRTALYYDRIPAYLQQKGGIPAISCRDAAHMPLDITYLLRLRASHSNSYIRSVEGTLSRSRTECTSCSSGPMEMASRPGIFSISRPHSRPP